MTMNTKHNQRSRATIQRIQDQFILLLKENHISKISIKELCLGAEINRSTFYTHYMDIYDLLKQLEGDMAKQMLDSFRNEENSGYLSLKDGYFFQLFTFIFEHKDFYQAYLSANTGNYFITFPSLNPIENTASVIEAAGIITKQEKEYRMVFFIAGLNAIIRAWLKNDCLETPLEMAEYINQEYHPSRELVEYI